MTMNVLMHQFQTTHFKKLGLTTENYVFIVSLIV